MEYTVDAKGRTVGRVATEVAVFLMEKNTAQYSPEKVPTAKVKVINANGLSITEKKKGEKTYKNYSGYPGGLRITPLKELIEKKGNEEALMLAVKGMLPDNKLKKFMLKNLEITA
jgi:large subunit ribosomal protein L13